MSRHVQRFNRTAAVKKLLPRRPRRGELSPGLELFLLSVMHPFCTAWCGNGQRTRTWDTDSLFQWLPALSSGSAARKLAEIPREPNVWGLVLVIYASLQALAATLGAELFTARIAFILAVTGTVLYLGGKAWVKALSFPLLLLLFMVPIPQILYARLTLSLQFLASQLAEGFDHTSGHPRHSHRQSSRTAP